MTTDPTKEDDAVVNQILHALHYSGAAAKPDSAPVFDPVTGVALPPPASPVTPEFSNPATYIPPPPPPPSHPPVHMQSYEMPGPSMPFTAPCEPKNTGALWRVRIASLIYVLLVSSLPIQQWIMRIPHLRNRPLVAWIVHIAIVSLVYIVYLKLISLIIRV